MRLGRAGGGRLGPTADGLGGNKIERDPDSDSDSKLAARLDRPSHGPGDSEARPPAAARDRDSDRLGLSRRAGLPGVVTEVEVVDPGIRASAAP